MILFNQNLSAKFSLSLCISGKGMWKEGLSGRGRKEIYNPSDVFFLHRLWILG